MKMNKQQVYEYLTHAIGQEPNFDITEIDLGRSCISDDDLQQLVTIFPNLKILDLCQTNIGDDSAMALASLPNLTKLYLIKTNVSDETQNWLTKLCKARIEVAVLQKCLRHHLETTRR